MDKRYFAFLTKNKWILIGSIFISIGLMVVLKTEYAKSSSNYVIDGESIVGIVKENKMDDVTLKVIAEKDGEQIVRKVTFLGGRETKNPESTVEDHTEENMDLAITRIVREANRTREPSIELPSEVENGIKLTWSNPDVEGIWVLPALFPPLIMVFLFRGEDDKKRKVLDFEKREILRELPSFNNKLVLLMGSGLVYEEALKRIGLAQNDHSDNLLISVLGGLIGEADKTNGDPTDLFIKYARSKKITDLKRMLSIISDNRLRGTNLIPKLSVEGELLWEKRKKRAEEEGRQAESKLTMPLGIMLISLLIVTAGPALLQM